MLRNLSIGTRITLLISILVLAIAGLVATIVFTVHPVKAYFAS